MGALAAISNFIDRLLAIVAKVAAWAGVVLIGITIFDVITRRFFVLGSTKLQEGEWHAHVVLFTLLIGYAYIKDAHVRIDLVRERLSERTHAAFFPQSGNFRLGHRPDPSLDHQILPAGRLHAFRAGRRRRGAAQGGGVVRPTRPSSEGG
jgi:hypothetical protein